METMQRLREFLAEDWVAVRQMMQTALRSDIGLLNEANDGILSHGGKMIRPVMSLLIARACAGAVTEEGRKVAAAAELMHNATLLHDDVADSSPQRRAFRRLLRCMATVPPSCWAITGWSRRWT